MVWLLILHIAALLMWCASLIYLPVLVAIAPGTRASFVEPSGALPTIERFVFTHVSTPFALLAIVAGTLVFIINYNPHPWLILKLTLVGALVICHALTGLLIMRAEIHAAHNGAQSGGVDLPTRFRYSSYGLLVALCGLIVAILWLVLAKPTLEWIQ